MKKISVPLILNGVICLLLLALPYYLFQGKLFVGGDDTRLLYSYPFEYLKHFSYFSWYNASSIGTNATHQFLIPFLYVWDWLYQAIQNRVIISYLGFSLPLILGFCTFQLFIKSLFSIEAEYQTEIIVGALVYILSPIMLINQWFVFLTAIWLLGVGPGMAYLYMRYVQTERFRYVIYGIVFSVFFSLSAFAIPWFAGMMLPIFAGGIVFLVLSSRNEIVKYMKRTIIYALSLVFSHAFWLVSFIAPYVMKDGNSLASTYASKGFSDTFSPIVLSTARSFVIYPLLNLFHRKIIFDFSWKMTRDFVNLYDHIFWINAIFILAIISGLIYAKQYFRLKERKIYLSIVVAFICSLYLFTVNIGPLKDVFLAFGKIPGFIMFRNFYDKFALGYVFLYAILVTIGLVTVRKKYGKIRSIFTISLCAVVLLNFSSVKSIVNAPLWTTENTGRNISMPDEYLDFMKSINETISSTNTIFSIPFGTSTYTTIKDQAEDSVYVGLSPVKLFSGVNDISGRLSFNFLDLGDRVDTAFIERDYNMLNRILSRYAINYIFVTKNIPSEVRSSWIYRADSVAAQDVVFLREMTEQKVLTSRYGNYELYKNKQQTPLLSSENLTYKKLNSVTYVGELNLLNENQQMIFHDSYNAGWMIYPVKYTEPFICTVANRIADVAECQETFRFFDVGELTYLIARTLFSSTHVQSVDNTNEWTVQRSEIKNLGASYYRESADGGVHVKFVLYYKPQLYFYIGVAISCGTLIVGLLYCLYLVCHKREI